MGKVEVFTSIEDDPELTGIKVVLDVKGYDIDKEDLTYDFVSAHLTRADDTTLDLDAEWEVESVLTKYSYNRLQEAIIEEAIYI